MAKGESKSYDRTQYYILLQRDKELPYEKISTIFQKISSGDTQYRMASNYT